MKRIALSLIAAVAFSAVITNIAQAADRKPGVKKADQAAKIKAACPKKARAKPAKPRKMLVLSYQSHDGGRFAGEEALKAMAETGAFELEFALSHDAMSKVLIPEKLKAFDAICLNNSTGGNGKSVNGKTWVENISEYVKAGGGLVGFHAATDNKLGVVFGGFFTGHPWSEEVGIKIDDPKHALTKVFGGKGFMVNDEIYQFNKIYTRKNLRILLSLDMTKTKDKGARKDKDNAVAWVRKFGKGRVFYCSLGHRASIFEMPKLMQFDMDGIQFALGDLKADMTPSGPLPASASTDPADVDKYTGEYTGKFVVDGKEGAGLAQIIAEGKGQYRAVLMRGLWKTAKDIKQIRIELTGKIGTDGNVPLEGNGWTGKLIGRKTLVAKADKGSFDGKWTVRKSPTLCAKPPKGAVILLPFAPGKAAELTEWANKSWTALPSGAMQVGRGSNFTVKKFGSINLHIEWRCPYEPDRRGQGRGNSGVYLQKRYEVQVLESFGLASKSNDAGSIYRVANTKINASLPPLQWQTYDIEFRAAVIGADGKAKTPPMMSVKHNGVQTHKDQVLPGKTTAAAASGLTPKDSLMLQDHGNKVEYRNVWVVEK
jgi:type 1 glutamine amidotransferase